MFTTRYWQQLSLAASFSSLFFDGSFATFFLSHLSCMIWCSPCFQPIEKNIKVNMEECCGYLATPDSTIAWALCTVMVVLERMMTDEEFQLGGCWYYLLLKIPRVWGCVWGDVFVNWVEWCGKSLSRDYCACDTVHPYYVHETLFTSRTMLYRCRFLLINKLVGECYYSSWFFGSLLPLGVRFCMFLFLLHFSCFEKF